MKTLLLAVLFAAAACVDAAAQHSRQQAQKARRVGAARVNPPRAQPASQAQAPGQSVSSQSPSQSQSPAREAMRRAMGGGGYTRGRNESAAAAARAAAESSRHVSMNSGSSNSSQRGWAPRGRVNRLRREDGGEGGAEEAPDNGNTWRNTPGALIRSEGLGYTWTQPAAPERLHTIESGNRITYEESKGQNLTNHTGVFVGAKDTPPPPGGIFTVGGASGKNAITER